MCNYSKRPQKSLHTHEIEEKFVNINADMEEKGLLMRQGTIVDATIIHAPASTKNKKKQRDPEMRSFKKGNNYYFAIKAHIGVDASTGMVHSVSTTAANVHDIVEADKLLHGEEESVWGDSGYIGIEKRPEHSEHEVDLMINHRRSSKSKGIFAGLTELYREYERVKSQVRSKVRTSFPPHQKPLWLPQDPLSRDQEKCG